MAAWRRKARASFPELASDLQSKDYTIYQLFFDLLPMSRTAHDGSDEETLHRVFEFAEWCLEQRAQDLANAAGVAFYEHLADDKSRRTQLIRRLSPLVVSQVRPLWKARLGSDELKEIDTALGMVQRKRHPSRRG